MSQKYLTAYINFGLKVNGVKELIQSENNKIVNAIFQEFSKNLIEFFTPIALKFEAESIIVGGNIVKAWKYFGTELIDHFNDIGIKIKRSQLGEKAICLGAARSMYNNMNT